MITVVNMHMAKGWAQRAFDLMMRDEVLPTPENYTVYYNYACGNMTVLNQNLDEARVSGIVTQDAINRIYDRFFGSEAEASFLKDAGNIIDQELKKVLNLVNVSMQGTNQFGRNLDQFTGHLEGTGSIDSLREVIGKIAQETRVVAAQNRKLQEELENTTSQLTEIKSDFERIHKEAQIDPLTEVGNRKFFDREITRALADARDKQSVLSMLMVDIDHFKKFNDTYGHLIGDQVLRLVARTLVENLKGRDTIARYGGEEFVILLPQTRVQDAERVANQLRASLGTKQIKKRGTNEVLGVVTVSLGAAEYKPEEDRDDFISRADTALYKAKQTGRNKVVCAE